MTLPPGQREIDGFPRFGTHFHEPPPQVPAQPTLEAEGKRWTLPLTDLPRREITADFHCVAGWSATGLRWEGVPFAAFYERLSAAPGVTHVRFACLDGFFSVALLEDLLADDVLLAEHLDGEPLDGKHGAPLRLVSPGQYGFINAKHVCRIDLLTEEPATCTRGVSTAARVALRLAGYGRFTRARVWEEERHRFIPPALIRHGSRLLIPGIRELSRRGERP
jgi:DMSO/TMAO reductase YedYZ molybdopterin-dependent catalytic subunit